jgi:hypothetical protein
MHTNFIKTSERDSNKLKELANLIFNLNLLGDLIDKTSK